MSKANQSLAQWAGGVDTEQTETGVVLDPTGFDSRELKTCPGCDEFVVADSFNIHLRECKDVELYLADGESGKPCPYCDRKTSVLPKHLGVCPEADHGGL